MKLFKALGKWVITVLLLLLFFVAVVATVVLAGPASLALYVARFMLFNIYLPIALTLQDLGIKLGR